MKKLKYFVTTNMFDCFNFSQDISKEKMLLLTAARQSSVQDPLRLLSIELSYKRREKHKNHLALIIYHGIITLWHLSPMLVYLSVNRFERKTLLQVISNLNLASMSYSVAQSINCTSDSEASVGSSTKLRPKIGYFKEKMAENE